MKPTITQPQRVAIMKLWGRVCKDRGWKTSDKALRLATFSELLGRPLASTNDVEKIDECTKLMNELAALLGVSLKAGLEADDQTINKARTIRFDIVNNLVPCLELYLDDVRSYITSIIEDKQRWWKIDRPTRDITIMDLNARPIRIRDGRTMPSQLEQLRFTLQARLNSKRKEAGHTIHDMKIKAGVTCTCAPCTRARAGVTPTALAEALAVEPENTPQFEPVETPF